MVPGPPRASVAKHSSARRFYFLVALTNLMGLILNAIPFYLVAPLITLKRGNIKVFPQFRTILKNKITIEKMESKNCADKHKIVQTTSAAK